MTEFFNVQLSSMGMGLMVLIPVLLALFLLAFGRRRLTLFTALVCVWIAGPASDGLNAVILGVPYNMSSGFYGISFFTILVTLYLLFSERSANTYGPHGRTAPENPKA